MYMLSYKGTKSKTFKTRHTIEECKADAITHAAENARIRGIYTITEVEDLGNGLVSCDLTREYITGNKHGKNIEWIDRRVK